MIESFKSVQDEQGPRGGKESAQGHTAERSGLYGIPLHAGTHFWTGYQVSLILSWVPSLSSQSVYIHVCFSVLLVFPFLPFSSYRSPNSSPLTSSSPISISHYSLSLSLPSLLLLFPPPPLPSLSLSFSLSWFVSISSSPFSSLASPLLFWVHLSCSLVPPSSGAHPLSVSWFHSLSVISSPHPHPCSCPSQFLSLFS